MEYTLILSTQMHLLDDNTIIASTNRINAKVPSIQPDKAAILKAWEYEKISQLAEKKYPLKNPRNTSVYDIVTAAKQAGFIEALWSTDCKYTEAQMKSIFRAGLVYIESNNNKGEEINPDSMQCMEYFQECIKHVTEPEDCLRVEIELETDSAGCVAHSGSPRLTDETCTCKQVPKITDNCITITKVIIT